MDIERPGTGRLHLSSAGSLAFRGLKAPVVSIVDADPRIRPDFDRLAVYEAKTISLTSAEVRALVDAAARVPHSSDTRIAVVVRCDVMYGMMRMFEIYGDGAGMQVRVFRDRAEADGWLAQRPR